jgi:hypothetical protein
MSEGVCHRVSLDRIVGGGKPPIAYSHSEYLEPVYCIGSLGDVGLQVVLQTEVGPDIPVGGSRSLSAEREAGSQCCIHKDFVAVKINVGRKRQSLQDCVCG